jgi:transaldolase
MRPANLKTKILLDSAAATDTQIVLHSFGFLDGQTTNPTLLAKHQDLKCLWPLTTAALWDFYKSEALHIAQLLPNGNVSVEVYADNKSSAKDLLAQAINLSSWTSNCYVKLPITNSGLQAAEELVKRGLKINMTLCFSQEQALAVHLATEGANVGQVFVSPFVGRLIDYGSNGLDLIKNILKMYKDLHSHVKVLTASIRNVDQLAGAGFLCSDLLTAPRTVLLDWQSAGFPIKRFSDINLSPLVYQHSILETRKWQHLNINHALTVNGLQRFASDWQIMIKNRK